MDSNTLFPARSLSRRRAGTPRAAFLCGLLGLTGAASASAQELLVPSGTSLIYNTDLLGQGTYSRIEIQTGAVLRVTGSRPLSLVAGEVIIDGLFDVSGMDSAGVGTLNTTNQPELGAPGEVGSGSGGVGSFLTNASTPRGGAGFGSYDQPGGGGEGGEASFSSLGRDARRGAGGGGGMLARNQPAVVDPLAEANRGLVATDGFDGGAAGTGAMNQIAPARGGQTGLPVFVDADNNNDFWGAQLTPTGIVIGEVRRPFAGRGGGAGGDAVDSDSFPNFPFQITGDEKGAGGGAGGGLVAILTARIVIGPQGELRADGGDGGGGENTFFFDRVGGGSGGGSGGWIILDALEIDLRNASQQAITALGGRGGEGRQNMHDVVGAGGNGGPGVVQFHLPGGSDSHVLLPPGTALEDYASPSPYVLLPILRR